MGFLDRVVSGHWGSRRFVQVFDNRIGFEQDLVIIRYQNRHLAVRRGFEKPRRLLAEVDIFDIVRNVLGLQQGSDTLHKRARFKADNFHPLLLRCYIFKYDAVCLYRRTRRGKGRKNQFLRDSKISGTRKGP